MNKRNKKIVHSDNQKTLEQEADAINDFKQCNEQETSLRVVKIINSVNE